MSLVNKLRTIKHNLKNVNNFTQAKVFFAGDRKIAKTTNFYLKLDGIFKMAIIDYSGKIVNVLKTQYPGFSIKYADNKMIIRNTLKLELENDLLFQYIGRIEKVSQARIYTWGQGSIIATIEERALRFNTVDFDDNIVSDDSTTIYDGEFKKMQPYKLTPLEEKKAKEDIRHIKSLKHNNVIHGLYTKCNSFTYKGRFYKGYYHYNADKKMFMTGEDYSVYSEQLKKIYGGRRF